MISDIVCEFITRKKPEAKDYIITMLKASGVIFAAMFLCLILLKFLSFGIQLSLLVMAAAIWLDIRIMQTLRTEYEYTIVNNDLTIDRIINMSRRKNVVTINTREIEELGEYDPSKFDKSKYGKCYLCASSSKSDNAIYAVFTDGATKKTCCAVMERSDKLLTTLRKCVSQNAYRSLVKIK